MALSLLESLRRLIRQDTVRVGGPVGNLYGTVTSQLDALKAAAVQSWLVFEVPGSQLLELEPFYTNFGILGGTAIPQLAQDGSVLLEARPGTIQLCRTTATVSQRTSFTLRIEVTAPGGQCACYVDGVLIRRGEGVTAMPISLEPGTHDISVVTNATRTVITAPVSIELSGDIDLPARPTWIGVSTDYLDPSVGSAQNTLSWLADAKVGGYYVLRRQRIQLQSTDEEASPTDATLLSVGEVGADGSFPVVIEGQHAAQISVGTELLAEFDSLGIVTQVFNDADGNTSVRCRAIPGTPSLTSALIGNYTYLGSFAPIAQITRTTNVPVLTYVDSAVTFGQAYEYALVAYGLINPLMRSVRSDIQYVVAGDINPPGSIVFFSGYPQVNGNVVTARFTAPADLDYQGVNVYYHETIKNAGPNNTLVDYTMAAYAQGGLITINDPELPPDALEDYLLRINAQGRPYRIVSNTEGQIQLESDVLPTPSGTPPLEIYRDIKIRTDYGLPGTTDELSFTATDIGTYYFRTFDRGRNEQTNVEGVSFVVDELDAGGDGQPIVAFRQLLSGEQAFFPDPFKDSTQYAIVELHAYNSGVPLNQKFTGVELWYRRRMDNSDRLITPIPFSGQAFPWVVSGAPQAVLDAPNWASGAPYPPVVSGGTLSRYVSLTRGLQDNWIRVWAENAAGFSTDVLTFVVDYDTTPEISSLETTIDNVGNTVNFEAVIDDDTQGFSWYVSPAAANEPTQAAPGYLGSQTLKKLQSIGEIALALGETKRLVLKPYAQWATSTATVASSSNNTVTFTGTAFPVNSLQGHLATYTVGTGVNAATYRYRILSNTATSITFARSAVTAPTNGTQVEIGYATGAEGEPVERQLVRTPRSFVSFENKNEAGERDVTKVTATFTMAPTPVKKKANFSASVSADGNTVTVNSGASWLANEYTQGSTSFFYCQVAKTVDGRVVKEMRRVVSTGTTTLSVVGTAFTQTVRTGTVTADVYDGAVLVRKRTNAAQTDNAGYLPTTGKEVYPRSETFYLDYYATSNGCLPENVRSVIVDPDTVAQLVNFTLTYTVSTRRLTANVEGTDDDAKYWVLYLKRGTYPVENAATTPPTSEEGIADELKKALDERFLRYVSTGVTGPELTYSQTVENVAGTWYAIGVPYNSFGQRGTLSAAKVTITGTGGEDPSDMLTAAARFPANTTSAAVDVTAQTGATGSFTVTATDTAAPTTIYTATGTFGAANSAGIKSGTATITNLPFTVSPTATTNLRTMNFVVTKGTQTLRTTGTYFATVGGPPGGAVSIALAATNAISTYDEGFCDTNCDESNFRPLTFQINFTTTNANTLLHRVFVEICVSYDDIFNPAVWDVVPTNALQSVLYAVPCKIYRATGAMTPVRFRVSVIRLDLGETVTSVTSAVYPTKISDCPGIF